MTEDQLITEKTIDPTLKQSNTVGLLSFLLCIIGYGGIYLTRYLQPISVQSIPSYVLVLDSLTAHHRIAVLIETT